MKIQTYHIALFARFLEKLKHDAGRRRLAAGSFGHPVRQQHEQQQRAQSFPAAEPGGRRSVGTLEGGRHLKYPDHTPMTNLLLSMLDKAGVPMDTLGDSTGKDDGAMSFVLTIVLAHGWRRCAARERGEGRRQGRRPGIVAAAPTSMPRKPTGRRRCTGRSARTTRIWSTACFARART